MINIQVYKLKCTTFYDKKKEKEKKAWFSDNTDAFCAY